MNALVIFSVFAQAYASRYTVNQNLSFLRNFDKYCSSSNDGVLIISSSYFDQVNGCDGNSDYLEIYCYNGINRLCLSKEYCPWRQGAKSEEDLVRHNNSCGLQHTEGTIDSMTCSPYGLRFSSHNLPVKMIEANLESYQIVLYCSINGIVTINDKTWCPPEQYSTSNFDCVACNICSPGHYQLKPCSANADTQCLICPNGQYQSKSDRGSCSGCSSCLAGQYQTGACRSDANVVCATCPRGQYQPYVGRLQCLLCDICQAGKYQLKACRGKTNVECELCPVGKYQRAPGQTECIECSSCQPGFYQTSSCNGSHDSVCYPCPIGQYQPESNQLKCVKCYTCLAGQYVASTCSTLSETVCRYCPIGQFQPLPGQNMCQTCSSCIGGQYQISSCSSISDVGCATCPLGQYQPSMGKINCLPCGTCPLGQFKSSECGGGIDVVCSDCPPGQFQSLSNVVRPDSLDKTDKISIISTPNFTCESCPIGKYQPNSGSSDCLNCSVCNPGQYLARSCSGIYDALCEACPLGQYQSLSGQGGCFSCGICPAGYYQHHSCETHSNVECQPCPAGQFQPNAGQNSCKTCSVCTPGHYQTHTCSGASNVGCASCPIGKFQTNFGDTSCRPSSDTGREFENPSVRASPSSQVPLESTETGPISADIMQHTIRNENRGVNVQSAEHSITVSSEAKFNPQSAQCTRGEHMTVNGCVSCPKGQYQPLVGAHTRCITCSNCNAGYYITRLCDNSRNVECSQCPANTYSVKNSSSMCFPCPQGRFSIVGATQCMQCTAKNWFWNGTNCDMCPLGQYSNGRTATCTMCAYGQHWNGAICEGSEIESQASASIRSAGLAHISRATISIGDHSNIEFVPSDSSIGSAINSLYSSPEKSNTRPSIGNGKEGLKRKSSTMNKLNYIW